MLPIKLLSGQIFENYCRCCLTKDKIMISVHTESTHNDNKTLADYLNVLFDYSGESDVGGGGSCFIYPSQICVRCSKALQVAYHFLLMSMEKKREFEEISRNATETLKLKASDLGNPKEEAYNTNVHIVIKNGDVEASRAHDFYNEVGSERYKDVVNSDEAENQINSPLHAKEIQVDVAWEYDEWRSVENIVEDSKKEQEQKIETVESVGVDQVPRSFKCCYCEDSFAFHESLIEHTQRVHKKMIPFKCKMCSFYTCFIESLWKHYKKQHALDDLENRLYRTKELLTISAEVEPPYEITLNCNECNFQTHTQTEMDEHLSVEHILLEDKDIFTTWYNCPSCYRQFYDKTSVKIHYSMLHNPQQGLNTSLYTCEKCGKTFDRKAALVSHERHCLLREPVACNFCNVKFSTVFKYEQHLQTTHSVDVKHECEICRKTFKLSSSLAVHRRRHNERYYQCNLCPKNYINNAELQVHQKRIHSRILQKTCSICGKTFPQSCQLREHIKTEHSKKAIQCGYCEFTSTSKFVIEVHQYRHTGRPYKCKFCPKQYVLRKDIKAHSKKTHGIVLADEELAAMFIDKHGYPSRFDAFSKQNNDLQIDVVDEMDLEMELKEFNLTFEDIINDLFSHKEGFEWGMK